MMNYPSTIGVAEDPEARFNYEMKFLIDPKTRAIPPEIFMQEKVFVSHIDDVSSVSNLRTNTLQWTNRGPGNIAGRTRAVAVDVRDNDIIIAGSTTGTLWRSTNGGGSWSVVSAPNTVNGITALVQDTRPGKEDTWYYGTGELIGNSARAGAITPFRGDGLFKSIDNGMTWKPLGSTATGDESLLDNPFKYITRLAINPSNLLEDEVLAAVFGGVVRSVDGGETWSVVVDLRGASDSSLVSLIQDDAPRYTDIAVSPDGIMYVVLSSWTNRSRYKESIPGVLRSEDGINWKDITPDNYPVQRDRAVLDVRKSQDQLYVFVEDADEALHLMKFFGQDETWTDLSTNLPSFVDSGELNVQGGYNMLVKIHPVREEVVYLGATNLYRSLDGFRSSFSIDHIGGYDVGGSFSFYPNHHPDQHSLIFLSEDPSLAISGSDGGVHLSSTILEDRVTWQSLNNGYVSSQFYTIAQDQEDFSTDIIGGMQDNGTGLKTTSKDNSTWQDLAGGDGGYCYITDKGNTLYFSFQFGRIFRANVNTSTGKTTFTRIDPDIPSENEQAYDFINPFVIDPGETKKMYLVQGDQIMRNNDLDKIPFKDTQDRTEVQWTTLNYTSTLGDPITAIELSESSPSVLYFGTVSGRLYKVTGVNGNRGRRREVTSTTFPNAVVSSISVNPVDDNDVAMVFSNYGVRSVFISRDGGLSFEDVSGNLEENPDGSGSGPSIRWIEIVPIEKDINKYFVGTSSGLFSAEELDGINTKWIKEADNQIGRSVIRTMSYRRLDGRLLVATHGNGVFETYVESDFAESNGTFDFSIESIYPNPIDKGDLLTIDFTIPEDGEVNFTIVDLDGKQFGEGIRQTYKKGARTFTWISTISKEGLYQMVMTQGKHSVSKKVIFKNSKTN